MKRFYFVFVWIIFFTAILIACDREQANQTQENKPTDHTEQSSLSASSTSLHEMTAPPPVTSQSAHTDGSVTNAPVTTTPVTTAPVTTSPLPELAPDEIVKVSDYIPSIHIDLRYSGNNNLAEMPIYNYSDAYLRYGTVQKLSVVQESLMSKGYSLLIWDAYRPLSAQFTLSEILPRQATSPVKGTVAYNCGDTLSLSIVRTDGSTAEVPYDFDCADKPESHDHSEAAETHAKLLSDAMQSVGFEPYLNDWYRFTDSDEYTVEPTLTVGKDGIVCSPEWVTVCDDTLTLRNQPDYSGKAIATLTRGQKVRLIYFIADFACVEVNGQTGFVLAGYLARSNEDEYQSDLSVVEPRENYSYNQMQTDLAELAQRYPDLLSLSSIGKSEEGRDLTLAVLGNPNAEKKIFLQSTIHAREYIVTELTMAQIDYMLAHTDVSLPDQSMTIGELLNKVCFYIVPMSNPDGVEIVQTGVIPSSLRPLISANKARIWKANAKGIDLNANFDADWDKYGSDKTSPDYMSYKGTSPECAAESKALADYLRANSFDLILSYHTSGSIIYYSYGGAECKVVNDLNYALSCRLSILSGFTINRQPSSSTAGLKDWAIQTLKTPSLTIEFASTSAPVLQREFDQIWVRTRDMLSLCGLWTIEQP